jgi:putative transposase
MFPEEEARTTEHTETEEKPLPTIWRVPDELWEKVEPILAEYDPPKKTGRPRVDRRAVLDTIIFRLRTGCQWNRMPKEFPDDSTVHRSFQRWVELGVLDLIWASLVEECEELGGVDWEWQAADGAMGKARLGGSRRSQPHRPGQKRGETFPLGRSPWRTALDGARRRQCARR